VEPASDISVTEESAPMFELRQTASLAEIVRAVNAIGAAPGDLVAILEALKQAGALRAELVIL
jgi:flagellar P-ring protein precursor FlgI